MLTCTLTILIRPFLNSNQLPLLIYAQLLFRAQADSGQELTEKETTQLLKRLKILLRLRLRPGKGNKERMRKRLNRRCMNNRTNKLRSHKFIRLKGREKVNYARRSYFEVIYLCSLFNQMLFNIDQPMAF
jgi:hypothetical protein